MRDLIKSTVEHALRSGDRIGVDRPLDMPERLGTDLVRLARLASSIHMADAAGSVPAPTPDRRLAMREPCR